MKGICKYDINFFLFILTSQQHKFVFTRIYFAIAAMKWLSFRKGMAMHEEHFSTLCRGE
jgi:hypothetical protein